MVRTRSGRGVEPEPQNSRDQGRVTRSQKKNRNKTPLKTPKNTPKNAEVQAPVNVETNGLSSQSSSLTNSDPVPLPVVESNGSSSQGSSLTNGDPVPLRVIGSDEDEEPEPSSSAALSSIKVKFKRPVLKVDTGKRYWIGSSNDPNKTDDYDPVTAEEYEKHVWDIIDSYFQTNRGLQSESIASYNRFVKQTIPSIVENCGFVQVEDWHNNLTKIVHSVKFTNVYIEKGSIDHSADGRMFLMFPHEARLRNLNYTIPLSVDVIHTITSSDALGYQTLQKEVVHAKIPIADIPIMVKSEFCRLHGLTEKELASYHEDPSDPGGYFIINGKEKVIVTQERPANNKLFLFKPMCDSKYQYECEIRSTVDSTIEKVSALWIHIPGNPKSTQNFKDERNSRAVVSPNDPRFVKRKSLLSDVTKKKHKQQYLKTRPGLIVTIATVRGPIPLLILYKALGFESDKEIWETFMVKQDDLDFYEAMRSTMENAEAWSVKTEEDALYYIGSKSLKELVSIEEVIDRGRSVISEEVLPALGPEQECNAMKGYHIGYMVNRLIFAYLGRIICDDRDHLQNKRFDLAGHMLATLFKAQVKCLMAETRLGILRRLNAGVDYDVDKHIIRRKLITRGIMYAMQSGNWGDKRRSGAPGRVGVCQLLNRLNGIATLSYLRRINSPVNRLVRMIAPRQVHTTGFGYICPADTPEGETVGLLKSLSVMAEVSTDCDKFAIVECLEACGYYSIEDYPEKLGTEIKILINSEIMGTCELRKVPVILNALRNRRSEYDEVEEQIRCIRRYENDDYIGPYRGFSYQVSVFYDREHHEIKIRTDSGRAYRPLLVVKNNQLVLQKGQLKRLLDPKDPYCWKHLLKDGAIEFLDAAECESAMIAMFPNDLTGETWRYYISKGYSQPASYQVSYTHCEIHPSMILGVCASLIPFPDHNQSPRNSYQSGMAKQALGVYQLNFQRRADPDAHVLHYPQRPLVTTKTAKFINYDTNPAGINAIAAIACYSGYNQEDSVIINKSAVQRGLFRSTLYRTKTEEAKIFRGKGDMDETFELPRKNEVGSFRSSCYTHLDSDGFPSPGIQLDDNDAVIGKTQMIPEDGRKRRGPIKNDASLLFRSSPASLPSYVDSVMLTINPDGYRMVKVKTRTPRNPQIGDKFASRHGQKGVVGMDFSEEDLPFTNQGICPDIILNPHAIPSRMTIGHLLETVEAKAGALLGEIKDATCFTRRLSAGEIGSELEKMGFHKHGMEVMYCGATGRKIYNTIFIGPVFYQRLKHMTEDKIHIRLRGPVTELCKQPVAGLQREGGLRFGEMERDSTITHGGASFLRERLFMVSDYHARPVCKKCGNFLTKSRGDEEITTHIKCRTCKDTSTGAATVEIPYACKLFFQELMAMNIRVQIVPEEDKKGAQKIVRSPPPLPDDEYSRVPYLLDLMKEDEF